MGIGGDKWPAAEMFCKLVSDQRWQEFFISLFKDKSVVELGAGTGLVSIIVDKLFEPKCIVVTDLDSHLSLIQENLQRNTTRCCAVTTLDWTRNEHRGRYDIILVLECVYNEDLYLPLIDSLDRLSKSNSIIFLGLTRLFAKPIFFSLLARKNFKFTMLPESSLPEQYSDEFSGRDVGLFVVTRCNKPDIGISRMTVNSQPRVEVEKLFDQDALSSLATSLYVNDGVCGYISYTLARHLLTLCPPRNRAELQRFLKVLSESSLSMHTLALPVIVASIRSRRELYASNHPDEFAPVGASYTESKDADGRSRYSLSQFYAAMLSIPDMQNLLNERGGVDGSIQQGIPLLRTCQQLFEGETIESIIANTSLLEERDVFSTEKPFSALPQILGRLVALPLDRPLDCRPVFVTSILPQALENPVPKVTITDYETGEVSIVEGSSLLCAFVEFGTTRMTLESFAHLNRDQGDEVCRPMVVECGGHYNVVLPLVLEDEGPLLLVLESMSNSKCWQHSVLAASMHLVK